jgi:UDP-glucose 4-epimerase
MQTNVLGTSNIIKLCRKLDIKKLIFSSTAAVYGNQNSNKMIDKKNQTKPINPYGISKLQAEYLLKEDSTNYKIDMICFRFLNACGGDKLIRIRECHNPETHLIPKLIQINLKSNPEEFNIYGNTFNTPDGYAYRDRKGEPAFLLSNISKANEILNWRPQNS